MLHKEMLTYGLLGLLTAGLLLHSFFPRYEWRTLDEAGSVTIVVYDCWTGRFQRAVYDDKGSLNVMGVFTPF